MPAASATTFWTAPATSAPITSSLVNTRKRAGVEDRLEGDRPVVVAEEEHARGGLAGHHLTGQVRPRQHADQGRGREPTSTSATIWVGRRNVSASMPLARLTSGVGRMRGSAPGRAGRPAGTWRGRPARPPRRRRRPRRGSRLAEQARRQEHLGMEERVLVAAVDAVDDLRLERPQRHVLAFGEDGGRRRAPGSRRRRPRPVRRSCARRPADRGGAGHGRRRGARRRARPPRRPLADRSTPCCRRRARPGARRSGRRRSDRRAGDLDSPRR